MSSRFKLTRRKKFNREKVKEQVVAEVITHFVILGITVATTAAAAALYQGMGNAQERFADWKLKREQKKAAGSPAAEEVVTEFDETTKREAMEAFLKANGVKNTHAMKDETLLAKCVEVQNELSAAAAAA